jgi:hypothetical protein
MLFARLQHQYFRDGGIRNYQTYPTIPSLPIYYRHIVIDIHVTDFKDHHTSATLNPSLHQH